MNRSRHRPEDFTVGWICALPIERAAAEQILDERYEPESWCDGRFIIGRIGKHNVVISGLPSGSTGIGPAAVAAAQMEAKFQRLQARLLVGIGGGVPTSGADVRLGDVVISQPSGTHGGVVQYDFGKAGVDGRFERTGFLNAPPRIFLDAITTLRVQIDSERSKAGSDMLFKADADHYRGASTCELCDLKQVIHREKRQDQNPIIHYGTIASGNQVIKDGTTRDQRSLDLGGVLCFEMEAAGLMNDFSCLVIRGVCDYADSHKNKTWQPYASATAAACAKEIVSLLPIPDGEMHASHVLQSHQSIFMVPFGRDKSFVGRQGILADIDEVILSDQDYHRRIAVVGLGGIGKSQVAVEYAYRVRDREPQMSVFWIHASNAARFEQGYRDIAERVALPGLEEPRTNILRDVHRWFSDQANGPWLIILDNVDDDATFFSVHDEKQSIHNNNQAGQNQPLETFLPQVPHGQILITSRDQNAAKNVVGTFGRVLPLEVMSIEESMNLFQTTRVQVDGFEEDARALIEAVDRIPMAIIQAASYIDMSGQTSISQYLQLFRESEQNRTFLLENADAHDLRRDAQQRTSVITTWQITFNQIRKDTPKATDLLALVSMFDRQGIPEYLIRGDMDSLEFDRTIKPLIGFSLVHLHANSFTMHRLVQTSTKVWLKTYGEMEKWVSAALKSMRNAFPDGDYKTWQTCQALLPHAREILSQIAPDDGGKHEDEDILNHMRLGNDAGNYLRNIGEYPLSELILRSCVDLGQRLRSSEQLMTPLEDDAVAQVEKTNSESPRPVKTKWRTRFRDSKLAIFLGKNHERQHQTERHSEPTKLHVKRFDEVHPLMLISMSNLSVTYSRQGRWKEAEELQAKELAICKVKFGEDDPSTLISMDNLAVVYLNQGQFKEAEELQAQVIESRKKFLGDDDPSMLTSITNLASTHWKQGRWDEAEKLEAHVLERKKVTLGVNHPSTLIGMSNLALTKKSKGQNLEAFQLLKDCASRCYQVLGPDHHRTVAAFAILESWEEDLDEPRLESEQEHDQWSIDATTLHEA